MPESAISACKTVSLLASPTPSDVLLTCTTSRRASRPSLGAEVHFRLWGRPHQGDHVRRVSYFPCWVVGPHVRSLIGSPPFLFLLSVDGARALGRSPPRCTSSRTAAIRKASSGARSCSPGRPSPSATSLMDRQITMVLWQRLGALAPRTLCSV